MHIENLGNQVVTFVAHTATAITANDNDEIQSGIIYIGTGGNIKVLPAGSSTPVIFSNVGDGYILPVMVVKVFATDTTATNLVALR